MGSWRKRRSVPSTYDTASAWIEHQLEEGPGPGERWPWVSQPARVWNGERLEQQLVRSSSSVRPLRASVGFAYQISSVLDGPNLPQDRLKHLSLDRADRFYLHEVRERRGSTRTPCGGRQVAFFGSFRPDRFFAEVTLEM